MYLPKTAVLDPTKFDGLDALKKQIAKDADTARARLADPELAADRYSPVFR